MHNFRRLFHLVAIARLGLAALLGLAVVPAAHGGEAIIAVATNFRNVAELLKLDFERQSGHAIELAAGSTGKLYAQIIMGAPYDAFLAADQVRPERLEREGFAAPGTRFTYAIGVLTLWSADAGLLETASADVLSSPDIRHVAVASPALAPYGAAAKQALGGLGLWDAVRNKLVMGQNVGETFSMVATGNAEAGFVALSAVLDPRTGGRGSRWDVPGELYDPIRQDAVLLMRGADNDAASQFLQFLRTPDARAVMRQSGYRTD